MKWHAWKIATYHVSGVGRMNDDSAEGQLTNQSSHAEGPHPQQCLCAEVVPYSAIVAPQHSGEAPTPPAHIAAKANAIEPDRAAVGTLAARMARRALSVAPGR